MRERDVYTTTCPGCAREIRISRPRKGTWIRCPWRRCPWCGGALAVFHVDPPPFDLAYADYDAGEIGEQRVWAPHPKARRTDW